MADEQTVAGRRRGRGAEASARAEALERLKALRSGGRRSEAGGGYDIKMENPIYDTVEEDEYDKLVARRREEAQGFIVDDDGLGYGDEGEEEDWSKAGLPPSSDESEGEAANRAKRKKKSEKKEGETQQKKVNSSLSAAAALMGKQRISAMFTSTVFKNRESGKARVLDCENIVDDVIAEFAPDESDRERHRRGQKKTFTAFKSETPKFVSNSVKPAVIAAAPDRGMVDTRDDVIVNSPKDDERNEAIVSEKEIEIEKEKPSALKSKETVKDDVESRAEVKEEVVVKSEDVRHSLNAKISSEDIGNAVNATAEWQELMRNKGSLTNVTEEIKCSSNGEDKSDFQLDADGSLPFYIIDAYEEIFGCNMGNIYLFGKVKAGNAYRSCCVIVKNMQRCLYAIPNDSIFPANMMVDLEKEVEDSQISQTAFRRKLQDMASEMKNEIAGRLLNLNISSFSMTPVKRSYAFERPDIPLGENYVLKINYPFKHPPLPADLKGETFRALFGTHSSALELFLVKRKVKGPSWLSVSKFSTCPASLKVSWCKFEISVDCHKDIRVSTSSKCTAEIPPVNVTAINLKTIFNEKKNVNEIVSASLISCSRAKIDTPMLPSEWKRPGALNHFTLIRKLDGGIFPMGFEKKVIERNTKAGSNVLAFESSERALLNRLMIELHNWDSDVLVGHNISGFDLDILLHRAQACSVPSSMWSKIGRLKRSVMPKLTKANTVFGSGASPGVMSCIAGRLLCDTFLCSRDLLKEVSYSLTQLAKTRLNKNRKEVAPNEIPEMFQTSSSLIELIENGETDALLSMELMFHLSVLPLTRQLTNISGNLWGRTLQGARAQRVEYLLLHAFHAKKYIVPDKMSSHMKEVKITKKRINNDANERQAEELDNDDTNHENDNQGKGKKGPAYAGGLVLEPKKGLYDKYVLLLDFNSLYPSIIQEYNICFTTVERSVDGLVPQLPSSRTRGVLPELLKNLVERRRMVKSWMKNASGLKVQQLDIQQQALKLTANSMYGCLGFSNSRFYAKPLAELITLQGREILQSTVDLVHNNLNLEVIYGDTDSIMIYSGLDDISKAKAIAGKVIQEVNKKYKCLEIDLDGLYKRMLLLKKKKYAAVKIQFKDGTPYETIERKGLDMVRRDWSLLAKEVGDYCLAQILSGGSCEDVVESIHNYLMKVQEDIKSGQIELKKYVITKTLTKPPEAYPDAKNQPHVLVALRLKQSGYTSGCSVGDTIPYVICVEPGASSASSTGVAQRARHPDELERGDGQWMIDTDYYLSQQIHPVVARLCASIEGTSPERLADCLGLDSSKFHIKSSGSVGNDPSASLLFSVNNDERFQNCEPLVLECPSCSRSFDCPAIFSSISSSTGEKITESVTEDTTGNFWRRMRCPRCPEEGDLGRLSPAAIANQVKKQSEKYISMYYKGLMMCDDETCKHTTSSLNLRLVGDSERGTVCPNYPRCSGRLVRKYSEVDMYKQLAYFCYLLDTVRCTEKMDSSNRIPIEKELSRIRPMVDLALQAVQRLRDRCAYGWIQLNDLAVTV